MDQLTKIIQVGGQDELEKVAGTLVTLYLDRFKIKQAASDLFPRSDLEELAPDKDHFMTHIVAMGSGERYGWNRNGDWFGDDALRRRHGTFVTHARNYVEHANQDPDKAVGVIKAARYDPDFTQRVELVLHTKIASAEPFYEKAKAGEELSGSMACTLPFDVCSVCGHESRSSSDRCDHIRKHTGQWLSGHKKYAYMLNPDPTFKDYSWVHRPADRIAWNLEYGFPLEKAASDGSAVLRGDELAARYGLIGTTDYGELLTKMASFDEPGASSLFHVYCRAFDGEYDGRLLEKMASARPERVMRSLLKRAMVVPLASFHSWITGSSIEKSASDPVVIEAGASLPTIRRIVIRSISSVPGFQEAFGRAAGEFEPTTIECGEDIVDALLDKIQDKFSLRYEALSKRAMYNPEGIPGDSGKTPSKEAGTLGTLYLAYLSKTAEHLGDDPETLSLLSAAHGLKKKV